VFLHRDFKFTSSPTSTKNFPKHHCQCVHTVAKSKSLASSISFINSFSVLYIFSSSAVNRLIGLGAELSGAGLSQNQEVYRYWKMSRLPLGAQPVPCSWVLGGHSPGTRQLGCETVHSSRSSSEVRHQWSYTSTAPTFILCEHRDNPLFVFLYFVVINS